MPFDQSTRNRLARFVGDARAILTDEFTRQLQNDFGLDPATGEVTDLKKLTHLDDARQETARILRETMDHYLAGMGGQAKKARQEVLERIVREQAFTVLNRLCALRMAEARGLLIESVAKGYQSKGFQLYARVAGNALGETGEAYKSYLFSIFDEFALDLAVLFDRYSVQGRLFPREATLLQVFDELNHVDLEHLWAEDETIGWIYQYWNSKEERQVMRKASAAPRNSRELAVRNQFFTPRYVVEFLTDNTLGRIWYEMTQSQTSLKDSCRYLVRRPNEIFLAEGQEAPAVEEPSEDLSQEELLQQPVYVPHRPLKDPREIRLLDPACGSMHFGLYAFDLFETIYEEAWEMQVAALSGLQTEGSRQKGDNDGRSELSGPRGLAEGHGTGGYGLSSDQDISERGEVRTDQSTAKGGSVDSVEHRRGAGSTHQTGIHSVSIDSPRLGSGGRNPGDDRAAARLSELGRGESYAESLLGDGALDHGAYEQTLRNLGWQYGTDATALSPLPTVYRSKEELLRAVPRLIIEHNIHGIDIDPRAVQIAGLSLWLRAQKSWQVQGVKAQERPQVQRSNIVCAEPMPGELDMLDDFANQLQPRVLGQLVKIIFERMKLAGEAGSLLKIEEEIQDSIAAAHTEYQQFILQQKKEKGFLPGMAPEREVTLFDFADLPEEEDFWHTAEQQVIDALRAYAEQADADSYQRRLFADDAARGFAFIDLCRKRYDAVVMNPPFGKASIRVEAYLRLNYPDNWKDLYAAFFERTLNLLAGGGTMACISSSQFLYTKQLAPLRYKLLEENAVQVFAHLGLGVLDDATVDTGLSVFQPFRDSATDSERALYLDVSSLEHSDKVARILAASFDAGLFKTFSLKDFRRIATKPFSFHSDPINVHLWNRDSRLSPDIGVVATGNHTFEDFRFLRLRWELFPTDGEQEWIPYEKGGEYQPYISPTPLMVDWRSNGAALREINQSRNGTEAQVMQSSRHWGRAGLCYSHVSSVAFGPRVLPKGGIFSSESISIFPVEDSLNMPLLGLLCSTWVQDLIWVFGRYRKIENRAVSDLPITRRSIEENFAELRQVASEGVRLNTQRERLDECSSLFVRPDLVEVHSTDCERVRQELLGKLKLVCEQTDDVAARVLYGEGRTPSQEARKRKALVKTYVSRAAPDAPAHIHNGVSYLVGTAFGRWDIRFAIGDRQPPELPDPFDPLPVCPPGMLQNSEGLPAEPHDVPADYPLRVSWPGILVDDENHPQDIVGRIREAVEVIWDDRRGQLSDVSGQKAEKTGYQQTTSGYASRAEAIEAEACEILGVNTLRDYFRRPAAFFADHLKRYSKSRRQAPIYWPLSTKSGTYTLWIYYHRLTDQTLYSCVNDFVEPKLKQAADDVSRLRAKTNRSSSEEKELERLSDLDLELKDFRDELLRIATFWKPNPNDGVQITAAPLWQLFRLPKWQKTLKDTWEKLEAGDYDWAHLALSIWPDRVVRASHKDRSYAIAHDLEDQLWEEVEVKSKTRGGKVKKTMAWRPKELSESQMDAIIAAVKAK